MTRVLCMPQPGQGVFNRVENAENVDWEGPLDDPRGPIPLSTILYAASYRAGGRDWAGGTGQLGQTGQIGRVGQLGHLGQVGHGPQSC